MLNNWEKMNRMVRITHEPTGVTTVSSEYRSQHRNRDAAYAQLRWQSQWLGSTRGRAPK